jgi:hypothetical protein
MRLMDPIHLAPEFHTMFHTTSRNIAKQGETRKDHERKALEASYLFRGQESTFLVRFLLRG